MTPLDLPPYWSSKTRMLSSSSTSRSSSSPSPSLALPLPAAPLPGSPTDSLAASPSGPAVSPADSTGAPTWPDPSSISLSAYRPPLLGRPSTSSAPRRRALLTGLIPRSTRFEVALVDRLSECLEGELESILEASGAHKVELKGEKGRRRLVTTGTSSAVTKARQLVDAKLSQTPIRVLLAIRLAHSDAATLHFIATPQPPLGSPPFPLPNRQLFRMRECPPSSLDPVALSAALAPHSHPSPSPSETQKSTPGANTDSSEASNAGYFSASSRSASRHSLLGASASSLPSIGSYCLNQQAYIEAVVDELETCVERRSLVKLKLCPGTSFFLAPKPTGAFSLAAEEKGWTVEDVEGWKIDGPHQSLSSHFSIALSRARAEDFRDVLVEQFGLDLSHETSHVHVQHLDRRRAVYASATSELRGSEIKGIGPGVSASGSLMLKKVSTLPSKPFFLSITAPVLEDQEPREGADLRIKVLSDKAATSPSLELSQSFNAASWDLNGATGRFEVHLTLDPDRFSASQTVIRYKAKSRYENETFRATLIEIRQHQTSSHWWELEITSKKLDELLARTAQSQQRRTLEREKVVGLVAELIDYCEKVVGASVVAQGKEEDVTLTWGGEDGDGTPQGSAPRSEMRRSNSKEQA